MVEKGSGNGKKEQQKNKNAKNDKNQEIKSGKKNNDLKSPAVKKNQNEKNQDAKKNQNNKIQEPKKVQNNKNQEVKKVQNLKNQYAKKNNDNQEIKKLQNKKKEVQNLKNQDVKKNQNDNNLKNVQNKKKKVQANGVMWSPAPVPKKKKTGKKSPSKGSFLSQLFHVVLFQLGILWVLYVVDYEKFNQIRAGGAYLFNATINMMPPEAVAKGREIFEYVRVPSELVINKASTVVNETSTFLNTNPLVKDHWAIVRDISLIFNARLTDYMRTVYLRLTGYFVDFKNNILP